MKAPRAPEAAVAAALAAAAALFLLPWRLRGLAPFWGDLTYLHQAWRSAPAALLQAGRAPSWEPSLYLGMPMAATMQGGLFYPATILYYVFGFADATLLFHLLHYFLAAWLTCLWLRTLRLSWGACAGGGLSLAFGGLLAGRIPFLNHLAVLAWAPALALFFRRRAALSAALALMFLAGYPAFIPGCAAVAWALALALRARRAPGPASWAADWAAAAAAAGALCAAQLFPALELAGLSRRAGGVDPAEALRFSFTMGDLRQWVSPILVPLSAFHPETDWWKCVYLGVGAAFCAAVGLWALPRRRAAALGALLAAAAVLILGGSNPLSRLLWTAPTPLRWVRYPGNLAYLALLPLAALTAAGLSRLRRAPLLAAAIAAELLTFGWLSTPVAPRAVFSEPGPLARALQTRLDGTRYLLSPRALESTRGSDAADWKGRLYGLSNAPSRIRAAGNFGEPLVPAPNYAFMDMLYSARSAEYAVSWLPWAGVSRLLTPGPLPPSSSLKPDGDVLWSISKLAAPVSLAYQLSSAAGAALPQDIPGSPPPFGRPLRVTRSREDRFEVSGSGAGWAFVAEPRYPGWRATLASDAGETGVGTEPALGPFLKVRVPEGPWTVRFLYAPASWSLGVLVSLGALLAVGGYWYHRASRLSHVA